MPAATVASPTRLALSLLAAVLALTATPQPLAAAGTGDGLPSREQWLQDVGRAMRGSGDDLRRRTAAGEPMLAVNLDIDNSALTSFYDGDEAVAIPRVKRYADLAGRLGVALLFNTGRYHAGRERTLAQLAAAGYEVAGLCMRRRGEAIEHSKQRCRARFAAQGWTLVANIGNNPTDFTGGGYERRYRLPSYGGRLG